MKESKLMAASNKRQMSKVSATYIAIGVALISLMTIIGTSAFLRTTEIRVEGASLYTVDEIIKSSGVSKGDNLLFVNAQNVSSSIRESLPFISAAKVTRIPPDTVLIEVTESGAIAAVTFSGELYAIDSAGRVLVKSTGGETDQPGINFDDLIEIRGIEVEGAVIGNTLRSEFGAETKLQNMQDVLVALEREGLDKDVTYLDVSSISNIHFGFMSRYRVILGGRSYLRQKLERVISAVEEIEHRHPNTPGDINMSNVTDVSNEVSFRPTQ